MAKAKEPKTTSTRTAKPAPSRAATASRPPAKAAPAAPREVRQSSEVIQTGASSGNGRAQLSPEDIYRLIQETAYYKAKARGFAPGHEVQDWIEAEAEVRMRLDNRA